MKCDLIQQNMVVLNGRVVSIFVVLLSFDNVPSIKLRLVLVKCNWT